MSDWLDRIEAASQHSGEALEFLLTRLVYENQAAGQSRIKDDMRFALESYNLIIDQGLWFKVHCYDLDDNSDFEQVLDAISALCPNWRITPGWNYMRNSEPLVVNGKIDTRWFMDRLNEITTLGGQPYRGLNVHVNDTAATYLVMRYEYATVVDYTKRLIDRRKYRQSLASSS